MSPPHTSAGQEAIEVGSAAPDFAAPDQDQRTVRLSALRGHTVVLYFYPRAETPGCTIQACGIRDRTSEYEAAGAVVVGVSPDPPSRLRRFAGKHGLPFVLVSDPHHEIARAYGAGVRRSRLGRTRWATERSTFVVGPDGTVTHAFLRVSPREHDEIVLGALSAAYR